MIDHLRRHIRRNHKAIRRRPASPPSAAPSVYVPLVVIERFVNVATPAIAAIVLVPPSDAPPVAMLEGHTQCVRRDHIVVLVFNRSFDIAQRPRRGIARLLRDRKMIRHIGADREAARIVCVQAIVRNNRA